VAHVPAVVQAAAEQVGEQELVYAARLASTLQMTVAAALIFVFPNANSQLHAISS